MALSPQKFREIVFQLLYSSDAGQPDESLMTELMMNELAVTKKNVRLAQERAQEILKRKSEIDPMIASVSTSYDFDRIQTVTRAILRLGVFEIFFDDEIPPKVAIAEAIRLSRKFNTPESASFVNALLDHLYQASLGAKSDANNLQDISEQLMQSEKLAVELGKEKSSHNSEDPTPESMSHD